MGAEANAGGVTDREEEGRDADLVEGDPADRQGQLLAHLGHVQGEQEGRKAAALAQTTPQVDRPRGHTVDVGGDEVAPIHALY